MRIPIIIVSLLFISHLAFSQLTPNDGFKLLDAGEYQSAYDVFLLLYTDTPENISVQVGYGRALGMKGQAKEANDFFKKSLEANPDNIELKLNYAESLLWMKEAEVAKVYYDSLIVKYPDNYVCYIGMGNAHSILRKYDEAISYYEQARVLNPSLAYIDTQINFANIGKGYLFLEQGKFNQSKAVFTRMLEKDSTSFDASLGMANSSFATLDYRKSKSYIDANPLDSNQLAIVAPLSERLRKEKAIRIDAGIKKLWDNSSNRQRTYNVGVRIPTSYHMAFLLEYKGYNVKNTFVEDEANNQYASIGINLKKNRWDTEFLLGTAYINSTTEQKSNALLFDFQTSYKSEGNHQIKALARKQIYDYTTSLVDKKLSFTDIGLEYNGKVFNTLGVFSQYLHTIFSDENRRDLALLSMYYNLKNEPIIKTGINLQYIRFKENVPLDYYSPNKLLIGEYFIEYNSFVNEAKKLGIRLELVPGLVIENSNKPSLTYRGTAELIYRPSSNFHITSRLMAGSYATAIESTGYSFGSAELNVIWFISKKNKKTATPKEL